jgi:hypothetical protein
MSSTRVYPAWKRYKKSSGLEELEREIEAGHLKVCSCH